MYCIFGDLHGDIGSLERFVGYVTCRKDVTRLFFTGDFFGVSGQVWDMPTERNRQYQIITDLLSETKVPIHAVPGNYDCLFERHFVKNDMHHKTALIDGMDAYGHGGSYHPPTEIMVRFPKFTDYVGQDIDEEYKALMDLKPKLVLSHNPIRKYNYAFLEDDLGEFLYFSGHNHSSTFVDVQNMDSHVRVIKPGAIGKTYLAGTREGLPQTFMMYDIKMPDKVTVISIGNKSFTESALDIKKVALADYRASEGAWLKQKK